MILARNLRHGDDVKQPVQLPIAACVNADGHMSAARARYGRGPPTPMTWVGMWVIAVVTSSTQGCVGTPT
jgi:hypothetical protein